MGGWPRAGTPYSRATCRGLIYLGLWAGASRRVFPEPEYSGADRNIPIREANAAARVVAETVGVCS